MDLNWYHPDIRNKQDKHDSRKPSKRIPFADKSKALWKSMSRRRNKWPVQRYKPPRSIHRYTSDCDNHFQGACSARLAAITRVCRPPITRVICMYMQLLHREYVITVTAPITRPFQACVIWIRHYCYSLYNTSFPGVCYLNTSLLLQPL